MTRAFYVDQDECISCGACVDAAPGAFELGAGGRAWVKSFEAEPEDKIREAKEICPTRCIHWEDEPRG